MRRSNSGLKSICILHFLLLACCGLPCFSQSAAPVTDSAAKGAKDFAELLSTLDKLVEHNRELEQQNKQLMDQIDSLHRYLSQHTSAATAVVEKKLEPATNSSQPPSSDPSTNGNVATNLSPGTLEAGKNNLVATARMDQEFARFWDRFNGSVGLGAIYNKGNQSTQYSLSSDVDYPRERWAASLSYDSTLSSSQGTSPSTRNQVDATAYRLMQWNNWFYKGSADFLESSEQGIDLQSTFAGGVGRYLKNTNRLYFTITGGFAYLRIAYQQSVLVAAPENVSSARISSQLKLFQFDRTNLIVTASLLPALSDPGRLHFNVNSSYYIKIWEKFNFNLSFYGNWDTRPPPGFSGSDYGTSAGLNWTFGNR